MKPEPEKLAVTILDFKIAVAAIICYIIAVILKNVGFTFSSNGAELEIIQKMTVCISCFLCVQDNVKLSLKAGINRVIITAIGGVVAIIIVAINDVCGNAVLLAVMIAVGIIATLFLCKAAKVPYINARIGCVTMILVACTLQGANRIWYGVFRLISTIFAVVVVMLVAWVFDQIAKRSSKESVAR